VVRSFVTRAQKSTLARNAAWLFAGQGLSFVVQAFYFIVLARLLGTKQYGQLAGAIALVSVVSQYSTLGSGILFLRYVSPDHSRFPIYWGNILMSTFLLGGLLAVGLGLSGRWLLGAASVPLLFPIAISDCLFQQVSSCVGQIFLTFEQCFTLHSRRRDACGVGQGLSLAVGYGVAGHIFSYGMRRLRDRDPLLRPSLVLAIPAD
jgi:hypothetical protein